MATVKEDSASTDSSIPFVRTHNYPERVPLGPGVDAETRKAAWIKAEQAKEERARIRQMDRERFLNYQARLKSAEKREWDIKADSEPGRETLRKALREEESFASNPWSKWTTPPPGM
ncbi:hypothetical protein EV44_g1788 [Erysiphe necator]|uniref:Uncharacterized protein n=1 Tax=Uncinula necator TaxID=52586 RepID=A0A0B1P3Y8_UNCNE|nr:hypothetical protein EV44_g1788 [Erysiphe necator]